MFCRYDVIAIDEELIFREAPGKAEGRKAFVVCNGLRGGDEKGAVGDFGVQKVQRHGINIGAVAGHCSSTIRPRLPAELLPQRRCGTVVGQRWQEVRRQRSCAQPVHLPSPLVGTKNEEFVLDNRSAEAAAKLVLFHYRAGLMLLIEEEIVRVKFVVAQELKCRTMQLIASGFSDYLHVRARPAAVSCVIQARLDLELLNGIRVGNWNTALLEERSRATAAEIVHVGSVHLEIVARIARSVYVKILSPVTEIRRVTHIRHDARGHRKDLGVVAGGKRKLRYGTAVNDGAECGVFRLHDLRGCGNLHGFLGLTQNHLDVERAGFRHGYIDRGWHDTFKPCGLKSQFVPPRREQIETVTAARIGLDHTPGRGGFFPSANAHGWDCGTRRISHSTGDRARAYGL